MKTLLLLVSLLILASCGGGGGGGKSSNSGSSENGYSEQQVESLNCLEKELGWMTNPPETPAKAMEQMATSNFQKCGGIEIYAKEVASEHPNFGF